VAPRRAAKNSSYEFFTLKIEHVFRVMLNAAARATPSRRSVFKNGNAAKDRDESR
jgi:hypothetical protein